MNRPIRLAVLLSGGGTTLQNLLDQSKDGRLDATVVHVVSNVPDVYGLVRAEAAGVPSTVVERKKYASRAEFSAAIFAPCRDQHLLVLAAEPHSVGVVARDDHRTADVVGELASV